MGSTLVNHHICLIIKFSQMVNLNGTLLPALPEPLQLAQRGLWYGDGLFETIRVFGGKILLMQQHWARLEMGLLAMRYTLPAEWSVEFFRAEILRIAPANARVRLSVWRSPGGLYAPTDSAPQFLLTAQALDSDVFVWHEQGVSIGFCQSVRLPVDALSGLKAPNAPRYVAAALEARERGWDDAVLLNGFDRVCEAVSSNIVWITGGTVVTPPLSEGPVTGVLRGLLPLLTARTGLRYAEKTAQPTDLLAADELLLTNAVSGIRWVRSCEGTVFRNTQTARLHQALVEHLAALAGGFG